jgi:hypothetical protein
VHFLRVSLALFGGRFCFSRIDARLNTFLSNPNLSSKLFNLKNQEFIRNKNYLVIIIVRRGGSIRP